MFGFLEGTESVIYKKATDMEIAINTLGLPGLMASFCETLLKNIYVKYKGDSERYIKYISLDRMINSDEFDNYLKEEYDYDELKDLNEIRNEANNCKHNREYYQISDTLKKKLFTKVFRLAAKYAKKNINLSPLFNDDEYEELLRKDDVNTIIQSSEKLKDSLEKTRVRCEELSKQIGEQNRKIFELKKIEQTLRNEVVDKSKVKEYQRKINDLEDEKDRLLKKRNELNQRCQLARNEAEKLRIEVDDLQDKNSELAKSHELKCSECAELVEKVDKLTEQINKVIEKQANYESEFDKEARKVGNKQFDESYSDLQKSITEVDNEKKKLYKGKEELEEYSNNDAILDALSQKLKDINQQIEKESPVCSKCGTRMVIKHSKYGLFFGCPKFSKNKNGCKGSSENISYNVSKLLQEKEKIEEVLYKKPTLACEIEYHYCDTPSAKTEYNNYFFDSLSLPKKIFKTKNESFKKYSKFQVVTNSLGGTVNSDLKFIYKLVLRLLNRGVLLPCESDIEDILSTKFNKDINASQNMLFDFVKYKSPIFGYSSSKGKFDSEKEKLFCEYAFPKLLGESWASYVLYQADLSMLVNDAYSKEKYTNSRVDFLINKNDKRVVIEIDGKEHFTEEGRDKDAERDKCLANNNCIVERFTNDDVDKLFASNKGERTVCRDRLNKIHQLCIENKLSYLDYDIKYLFAIKLFHQLCITLALCLEKGYIPANCNLKLKSENIDYSQSELDFIMYFACEKVTQIIKQYCNIYGVASDINLLNEDIEVTCIYYGDGVDSNNLILIRDLSIDFDFLCEFDKTERMLEPKHFDLSSAQYFLKYIFDFNEFREGQFQALERIVFKKNSIILLPTGAGKSIIYQLGSFITPGMTIVISPLKALINDQISNLNNSFGITNVYKVTSDLSADQRNEALTKIKNNGTSLLYIAPERLHIPSFKEAIKKFLETNLVYCLAIDEVHCVSEWGHDFRPAYINIANAAQTLFKTGDSIPSIIGLTGTASKRVLNDVKRDLRITSDDSIIAAQSFDRRELSFSIIECESKDKEKEIEKQLIDVLPNSFGISFDEFASCGSDDAYSGIIFTQTARGYGEIKRQYSADYITDELLSNISALKIKSYYSTQPNNIDKNVWEKELIDKAVSFKNNDINLLVATKAFGMGIDKPNIRYIIHDGIPPSYESYYQEAGRAGRDRRNSLCTIIFSNQNDAVNEKLLDTSLSFKEFKEIYDAEKDALDDSPDDLSTLLYFHQNNYRGIDEELIYVSAVLSLIEDSRVFSIDSVKRIVEPQIIVSEEDDYIKKELSKNDLESGILKVLIRLRILEVIGDYSYDYKSEFVVVKNDIVKERIATAYSNYVCNYDTGRSIREKRKITECDLDGFELVYYACKVLINYAYANFEKSRRREIKNIYDLAKRAISISEDERNEFIRNEIVKFFNTDNKYTDAVKMIVESKDCGFNLIANNYDLYQTNNKYTAEEEKEIEENAKDIIRAAAKEMEDNPDHPGLLYFSAISRLMANQVNENEIFNEIKAANKFIRENYVLSEKETTNMFIMAVNAAIDKSYNLFKRLIEMYTEYESRSEITNKMLESNLVSDRNKDIILLDYLNNTL